MRDLYSIPCLRSNVSQGGAACPNPVEQIYWVYPILYHVYTMPIPISSSTSQRGRFQRRPLQRPTFMWAPSQMYWGECPWCPYFSAENLSWPSGTISITCSAAISIRLCRRRQGVWQEGKRRLRGEPIVAALWEGQASSGGSFSVWDWGTVNGCDARRG